MMIKSFCRVLPALAVFFAAGCGKTPVPEIELVPGTALVHIHLEPGASRSATDMVTGFTDELALADSLLKMGPIGVSLVGVDITSLSPQLLILSRHASPEYTAALAARQLSLDPREQADRVDLVASGGYARAAVAERNGWTALYIGPAPHVTIGSWLTLEKSRSLAADEHLQQIIPEGYHVTVLLSGNLFSFLSLLPLERQIDWWQDYKDLASRVQPAAMAFGLYWPEPEKNEPVRAMVALARRDHGATTLSLSVDDNLVDTDSMLVLLQQLAGGIIQ